VGGPTKAANQNKQKNNKKKTKPNKFINTFHGYLLNAGRRLLLLRLSKRAEIASDFTAAA